MRGIREERRLYFVAVSSLSVAFLCVCGALLGVTNLGRLADRWGQTGRLSIYLHADSADSDVARLQAVLRELPEVSSVEHLTSENARALFLEHSDVEAEFGGLPAEAFPASVEVELKAGTPAARIEHIAARVSDFRAVSEVESYRGWFARLDSLLTAGRGLATALVLLVGLCVLAVIANTIRLAVARRREEIEVLKLCGATNGFVRGPFLVEGTFQGALAAAVSVILLLTGFVALQGSLDTVAALTGTRAVFLEVWMVLAVVFGGAFVGMLGSALALRRYLVV